MWVWARGPPQTCFLWASAFSVLGCVAGNLSVESPHHEEVQSGSRRLVFSSPSMDLHYKLVCPAKWKEILIVFSHLSFPNASTSSGVVIKSKTYFKHVLFVFFLEWWWDQGLELWNSLWEFLEGYGVYQDWWWWFEVILLLFSSVILQGL